jgi:hypothetical protein
MSGQRVMPILLLCALAVAGVIYGVMGRRNQNLNGVIVFDTNHFEFYPDVHDCNLRGPAYLLLPNARFQEIVNARAPDPEHLEALLHSRWRAKLNGNLSAVGWYGARIKYWRELSVNYVVDAVEMSCGNTH